MLNYLRKSLLSLYILHCLTATAGNLDFSSFSHDEAFSYSQAAIGKSLKDIELTKSDGSSVRIEDYRGKPLVLSMIYTSCHHVCPSTTQYLNEVVKKARSALDEDSFQVVTVGFDSANDNPARMEQFRKRTAVEDERWDFLSGSAETMKTLSEQLGFIYFPSPKGFEHLVQSSVIDNEGVIYRHVYGISFDTPLLIEPLKDLVFDRPKPESTLSLMANRIRLFCTVYDPATDSYRIDISVFIGTFVGMLVSIVFGTVLVREWRRSIQASR